MNRSLKVYDLSLKVQGPVFVGSGYEIQKKEYLFLNRSTVGIVDAEKLYLLAKRRHLEDRTGTVHGKGYKRRFETLGSEK